MPRKRKSDQQSPTETNTAITEPPAAETTTVVTEPPAAEATTAVAEPPAAKATGGGSFAQQVGQKTWKPAPDPFPIARDNLAGVRLMESKQDRQMAIKFGDGSTKDKPSQAVIEKMKESGYRWNPEDRIWAHPVRPDSAMRTRIEAEQLYQEVRQMIRQEKGIEPGTEMHV